MISRGNIVMTLFFLATMSAVGQVIPIEKKDTTINNLVLPFGYKTSEYGAIPEFRKEGRGKQAMILIPGLGLDGSIFDDFVKANQKKYTFYIITIPGFGRTSAPPLPTAGTSYGQQYWNKGVLMGISKLIEKQNIQHAIIVGCFVQGSQLALRMAIEYPDKVAKVIAIGGAAKFIYINKGVPTPFPLPSLIAYTDNVTRNQWFKNMPASEFNDGNYLPEIYSLDKVKGQELWEQVAHIPTSVMVEYLCEFSASDITLEVNRIKCPVLVLRPEFNATVLGETINNYVKPQFIDAWEEARTKNPGIKIQDIPNAASVVWKDNPAATYKAIDSFLK